jgi:hypothetical protein
MAVNAFAAPRRRTFWKWQWGCLVAQKAFMTQPLGSRARHRPCGNAHRVPRLFERSRQLCLRHHSPNFLRRSLLRPVNRTPEVKAQLSSRHSFIRQRRPVFSAMRISLLRDLPSAERPTTFLDPSLGRACPKVTARSVPQPTNRAGCRTNPTVENGSKVVAA